VVIALPVSSTEKAKIKAAHAKTPGRKVEQQRQRQKQRRLTQRRQGAKLNNNGNGRNNGGSRKDAKAQS
jgi:hypothetical protein